MKLIFTSDPPTKTGYYWWTNFGEHTPTVVEVTQDYSTKKFWAANAEFCFEIKTSSSEQQELPLAEDDEEDIREKDGSEKYKHGDELWCYIPNPYLPSGEKQIKPDSY
jgi:hypothetical protein